MNLAKGLFICDGCDRAIGEGQMYAIGPMKGRETEIPETKRKIFTFVFCRKCSTDDDKKTSILKTAAERYAEWIKQT